MKFTPLACLMLVVFCLKIEGQDKKPVERFANEIKAYEEADQKAAPPEGAILFVGASGIRLWKTLEQDFPEHKVINRGFGGSHISDSINYADRIIIPYKPRLIVLQAGGNDIAGGKSPGQVAQDFKTFVEKVREKLPEVRIAFLSLQPSPARITQMDKQREANRLIREQITAGKNMVYIEAFDAFLNADGKPRAELFVADMLHHNAEGYKLRVRLVKPYLDAK